MITSLKERDLVVNIHQFSLVGLPEASPSVPCQHTPRQAKLGDRRKDSISASCHHCLLHPYSTNLLPLVEAKMTGEKCCCYCLFLREIMSKINNAYRFNPNVSHKMIFQCLDV